MARTSAQRQAALVARKREASMRQFNIWLPATLVAKVDNYASALSTTRADAAARLLANGLR